MKFAEPVEDTVQVERRFWRLKLKNLFLERTGIAFQQLVQEILRMRFPDEFVDVKPAGRDGDWKCDGFLTSQKRLFQIYAPESWKKSTVLAKINEDYAGAIEHWGEHFNFWTFTHNKINGIPPYVLHRLLELSSSDESHHTCEHWGFAKLRDITFELENEQLEELLGPAVSLSDMLAVEVRDVIPVLQSIEQSQPAPPGSVRPVPSTKLDRNGLSDDAVELLLLGMRRSSQVQHYFLNQTSRPLFRDDLGTRFQIQYTNLREEGLQPDEIVTALLEWIAGAAPPPKQIAAGMAVIAFFFEECDIFEAS